MNKNEIRREIKTRKCLLTDDERNKAINGVFAQLEQLSEFISSNRILIYYSLPDELSTHEFIAKWNDKKQFFLPRVNGANLEILPYYQDCMQLGAFRIEEPSGNNVQDVETMDLIVVPAVAFDRLGNRIGRGKGFYDRLLLKSKAPKIGIAYDFQILDTIDVESHDIPVDIVISETGIYHKKHQP